MSDTDAGDRVAVVCPSCSPREETIHEVLKPGGDVTVRCGECGHVHKTQLESVPSVDKKVIVSQDGESFSTHLAADPDETVEHGDEFIVDTPEAILQVRVTGIELLEADKRVEAAVIEDVEAVWTRAVDNVGVNVTLHPKDGSQDDTRSLKLNVPGDYEFTVGETETFGDDEFTITGIFVRNDAEGYRFDKFDERGDMVYAKDSKRIYGTDETTSAWSAW